jgi:ribosomal subunit interface protein
MMQITVSGKQVDLSDALRTRVSDHLDVIASKYFDHALEAQVTFSRARSFFICDINVHAGRGLSLRGEGEAADANTAFDDAAEHIAKRLRRYRRRVNEHARDSANRERPEAARQYTLRQEEGTAPGANGEAHATVIAEQATEISLLSVSEAVMRMDLADQPVLMFRNTTTGELNVVYRRSDGNIGWIDPGARLSVIPAGAGTQCGGPGFPLARERRSGSLHLRRHHLMLNDRRESHLKATGNRHRRAIGGMDRERRGPVYHHRLYIGDLLHAELRELLGRNVANVHNRGHRGTLVGWLYAVGVHRQTPSWRRTVAAAPMPFGDPARVLRHRRDRAGPIPAPVRYRQPRSCRRRGRWRG